MRLDANRLSLIAQLLGLALVLAVLIISTLDGSIVIPGWGGAGP